MQNSITRKWVNTFTDPLKVMVKDVLLNPTRYSWTLQGFGMLRCQLPNESRLNIWDANYQYYPTPSKIHDHPWSFKSFVICGILYNKRYFRHEENSGCTKYYERHIKPGIGTKQLELDKLCSLVSNSSEAYEAGECYEQTHDEIHETNYINGTITLNIRDRGKRPDVARVYYLEGQTWVTAEPRLATEQEVKLICQRSLDSWF